MVRRHARSLSLYRRIARLDEQAAQRASDQLRKKELTIQARALSRSPHLA